MDVFVRLLGDRPPAYMLYLNGDDSAQRCDTLRDAIARFREFAEIYDAWECAPPNGRIHRSWQGELTSDTDYILSVGPRGGVRCKQA